MTDQNDSSSEVGGPRSASRQPGGPHSPGAGRPGPTWQVQDAKARFSELLDASLSKGPQIITRRGAEIAVVVPIEQWRRLESAAPSLKDWLLESGARAEVPMPHRKKLHLRPVGPFE